MTEKSNFNPYTMYDEPILYCCTEPSLSGFTSCSWYSAIGEKEGDYETYLILQDGRTPLKKYFVCGDTIIDFNVKDKFGLLLKNKPSRIYTLLNEKGVVEKVDLYRIQTVSLDKEGDKGTAILVSGKEVKAGYELIEKLSQAWEEFLNGK